MYPNLNAEMARNEIEQKDIAKILNKGNDKISLKFKGKRPISLEEAKIIKCNFFPNLSLEYLFKTKDECLEINDG